MIKMNVVMKMIGAAMLCLLTLISLPSYSHADVDRRLLVKLTLEGKPMSAIPISLACDDDDIINPLNSSHTKRTDTNGVATFYNIPNNVIFSAYITNFPSTEVISSTSATWMKESEKLELSPYTITSFYPTNKFIESSTSRRLFDPIAVSELPSTNSIAIDFKLKDLVESSLECCIKDLGEFETAPNTFRCFKTDTVSIRLAERFSNASITNQMDQLLTPKMLTSESEPVSLNKVNPIIESIELNGYSIITNYVRYSTIDLGDVSTVSVIAIENGFKVNFLDHEFDIVKTNSFQINPFTNTTTSNGGIFFGDSFIDYDNNGNDECGEVQIWQKPDVYIPTVKYWLTTSSGSTVPNSEKTFRTNGRNLEENKYVVSNLVKLAYYKLNIAYPNKFLIDGYEAKEKHGFKRVMGYPKTENKTYTTTTGTESNVLSVVDAFAVKIPSTSLDEYDFEYMIHPNVGYTPTLMCSEYDNSVSVYTNGANHTFNMSLTLAPNDPKAILISNYTAKATYISEDASTVKELDDLDLSGLSASSNNHRTNPITFNFSFIPEESGKLILNISALGIAPMYNGNSFKFNTGLSKIVSADFILTNVVKRDLGEQVMSRSEFLDLMENKGVEPLNEIRSKFGLVDYVYEPSDQFVTNRNEQIYFKEAINELAKMTNSIAETAVKEFIPNEYIYSGINEFDTSSYFFNEQKLYKTTIGSGWFDKIIRSQLHSPCNWVYYLDTAKHQGHAFSSNNKSDNPIFNLETGEIAVDNPTNYTHWFTWVGSTESSFTDAFCYFPCLRYLHWPDSNICHQKMIKKVRCPLTQRGEAFLVNENQYGFYSETGAQEWFNDHTETIPKIVATATNNVKDVITKSEPIVVEDTRTISKIWKVTYLDGNGRASSLDSPLLRYKLYGQQIKIQPAPTLADFDFMGWHINWPNYWFANDLYSDNLSPTFIAVWKQQETKAISINNGTITLDNNAFKEIKDDNPLRTQLGYTHWVENKDDNGTFYAVKTNSTISGTIKLEVEPNSTWTGSKSSSITNIKFCNQDVNESITGSITYNSSMTWIQYYLTRTYSDNQTFDNNRYIVSANSEIKVAFTNDGHSYGTSIGNNYELNTGPTGYLKLRFGNNNFNDTLYLYSHTVAVDEPGTVTPTANGTFHLYGATGNEPPYTVSGNNYVDLKGKETIEIQIGTWNDRTNVLSGEVSYEDNAPGYLAMPSLNNVQYYVKAQSQPIISYSPQQSISVDNHWENRSSFTWNISSDPSINSTVTTSYSIQADKIDWYYSIQLKGEWDEMVDNDGVMENKTITKHITMPAIRHGQSVDLRWFKDNRIYREGYTYTKIKYNNTIYDLNSDNYSFSSNDPPDTMLIFEPIWEPNSSSN